MCCFLPCTLAFKIQKVLKAQLLVFVCLCKYPKTIKIVKKYVFILILNILLDSSDS